VIILLPSASPPNTTHPSNLVGMRRADRASKRFLSEPPCRAIKVSYSGIIALMKNLLVIIGIVVLLAGGIYWSKSLQSKDLDIISTKGLHWHPTLEIFVRGETVEIPPNIGLGAVHNPVHTHDDLPVIHLEFNGIVRKEDTKLKKFFEIWGKDMKSFGESYTITVNDESNTDLENYEMKDGDKIIINYQ